VRAHDVVITPGAQAGLATVLRALVPAGAPVLLESPAYLGAIAAARAAGLRVVPVPVDRDGVRPDLLADAFERTGARLFVCQPLFANPTGATLAADRRAAVLDAVGGRTPSSSRTTTHATSRSMAIRRRRSSPTIPTATSSTCGR
jgi:DNA-binding transcriptional MocR family regulator